MADSGKIKAKRGVWCRTIEGAGQSHGDLSYTHGVQAKYDMKDEDSVLTKSSKRDAGANDKVV